MADSELGEVRRPQRSDLDRLLRATGYRSQGMAGGNTDTVSPLDESDDSGLTADGTSDDGDETPSWFAEVRTVTSATTTVLLTYSPLEYSEVLRLNGIVMVRGVDYSISQRTVTLLDPSDLLAGIASDEWTIEATYPHVDEAVDEPEIVATIASTSVDAGEHEATLPGTVVDGDMALLITGGHMTGFTGGFATWTKIWGGSTDRTVALWLGRGVGSGTTISHTVTGSLIDDAQFVLALFSDVVGAVEVRDVETATVTAAADDPAVTPTVAVEPGELVICAVRGDRDGNDTYHPDTTHTDTGFDGAYVAKAKGALYGNGVAMSIGYATDDEVSSSIDMVIAGGTAGAGQVATIVMAVDW
jgi:hypothetical protein